MQVFQLLRSQRILDSSLLTTTIRNGEHPEQSAQSTQTAKTGQHGLNRCSSRTGMTTPARPHPPLIYHMSFGDDKHNQTFQTRVFDLFGELKPTLHVSLILKTTSRMRYAFLRKNLRLTRNSAASSDEIQSLNALCRAHFR